MGCNCESGIQILSLNSVKESAYHWMFLRASALWVVQDENLISASHLTWHLFKPSKLFFLFMHIVSVFELLPFSVYVLYFYWVFFICAILFALQSASLLTLLLVCGEPENAASMTKATTEYIKGMSLVICLRIFGFNDLWFNTYSSSFFCFRKYRCRISH